jgi:hypothetical protein
MTSMIETETIVLFPVLSDAKDGSSFDGSCAKIPLTILTLACDDIARFIRFEGSILKGVENCKLATGLFEVFEAFKSLPTVNVGG